LQGHKYKGQHQHTSIPKVGFKPMIAMFGKVTTVCPSDCHWPHG